MTQHFWAQDRAQRGAWGAAARPLEAGWLVSHRSLWRRPAPAPPAPTPPPSPGLPPPAGATLGPLDLCPSDLEEVLGDQDCPLELQTGKVSPRGLE